jgi:hypothetical protein
MLLNQLPLPPPLVPPPCVMDPPLPDSLVPPQPGTLFPPLMEPVNNVLPDVVVQSSVDVMPVLP